MAASTRYTGKYAAIYLGAILVSELRDVRLEVTPDVVESKGMGVKTPERTMDGADYKVTATRHQRPGALGQLAAAIASCINTGTALTVKVYHDSRDASTLLYQGSMLPDGGSSDLSDGSHQTEDISFVAAGTPVYYAGVSMGGT